MSVFFLLFLCWNAHIEGIHSVITFIKIFMSVCVRVSLVLNLDILCRSADSDASRLLVAIFFSISLALLLTVRIELRLQFLFITLNVILPALRLRGWHVLESFLTGESVSTVNMGGSLLSRSPYFLYRGRIWCFWDETHYCAFGVVSGRGCLPATFRLCLDPYCHSSSSLLPVLKKGPTGRKKKMDRR